MKVADSLPNSLKALNGADVFTHGHLPIAAAYCRRLGLIELVNQMVPSQMELKPGLVVQAMVLDTLSGRTPLYRIKDFMADQDVELLLGTAVDPATFHDTNLARSLDAIFEAGPSKIISALGVRATQEFALDTKAVSYDTTSTSVWVLNLTIVTGKSHENDRLFSIPFLLVMRENSYGQGYRSQSVRFEFPICLFS